MKKNILKPLEVLIFTVIKEEEEANEEWAGFVQALKQNIQNQSNNIRANIYNSA